MAGHTKMAQTGFTPISNYYSATATNVPTAGNLVAGELAINTADGKLFYKDSSGVVQTIASKSATAGTYSSITTNNLTIGTTQLGAGNASIMKNRIINGAMVISQAAGGASVTQISADLVFPVDRTNIYGSVTSKFTAQQNAGSVTTPVGFANYLGVTSSSAYSVGAGDVFTIYQNIEGFNTSDLNWDVSFNATKYERRIDKIAVGQPIYTGTSGAGTGGTSQILAEGYTPNSFFVYKQLYNESGAPIEGAFADLNGDGIITGLDRYIYKNADPDLLLGFTSNLNYKNFDLSFNLRASIGNRILNTVKSTGSYYSQLLNGELQNVSTNVLYTNFENQNGENVLSDMFIENGSFIRMDYATLGYTFPKWLEGKASLRLFTGVQNPFIITKYSGLDPEIPGSSTSFGVDWGNYPPSRTFNVGVSLTF